MSDLSRKSAVVLASAAIAFTATAGPVAANGHKGHHKEWTAKQCSNQAARWKKAHKHPTAKQTKQENALLAKHGCAETV